MSSILSAFVQMSNFEQRFLEEGGGLLGLGAQIPDVPPRGISEKLEDEIQQLVPRHTSHTLCALSFALRLGFLQENGE